MIDILHVKYDFLRGFITGLVLAVLIPSPSWAQEPACNEDSGYPLASVTSEAAPDRYIGSCVCVNWDAPVGITTHHYHVFVDGLLEQIVDKRAYLFCAPEKNVTHAIRVVGVAGYRSQQDIPIGNPYFLRWTDLSGDQICLQWSPAECLEGERIVPCS